jgi:outer membrane protein assembly factor BamB
MTPEPAVTATASPTATPTKHAPIPKGDVKWKLELPAGPLTESDGVLYFAGWDGAHALDAVTGQERWKYAPPDGVSVIEPPVIANGTVYVLSLKNLYAIDAETGHEKWHYPLRFKGRYPTVVDDIVLVQNQGTLEALEALTGEQLWEYRVKSSSVSSPITVSDDTMYFATRANDRVLMRAVDLQTRTEQWRFPVGVGVIGAPVLVDGTLYFGGLDQNVYALDATTGVEKWRFETGHWVGGSPALADGVVYIGSRDGYFYAVDAQTGQETWRFKTGDATPDAAVVADGVVYFAALNGNLYALDALTGKENWRFKADAKFSPVVVDGIVFVSGAKDIYALQ